MSPSILTAQDIPESIYDFELPALEEGTVSFEAFQGKYILVVNVASRCGHTPQYAGLQKLYEKYQDRLVVVGAPCNQFGEQEPGSPETIARFCEKNFGVTFPMVGKLHVKGPVQHPLYTWLTEKRYNQHSDSEVRWNFHKYLIDPQGRLVGVYPSHVEPDSPQITQRFES